MNNQYIIQKKTINYISLLLAIEIEIKENTNLSDEKINKLSEKIINKIIELNN